MKETMTPQPWQITDDNEPLIFEDGRAWAGTQSVFVYRGKDIKRRGTTVEITGGEPSSPSTSIHLGSVDAACKLLELAAEIVAEWSRHEHGPTLESPELGEWEALPDGAFGLRTWVRGPAANPAAYCMVVRGREGSWRAGVLTGKTDEDLLPDDMHQVSGPAYGKDLCDRIWSKMTPLEQALSVQVR